MGGGGQVMQTLAMVLIAAGALMLVGLALAGLAG